MLVVHSEAFNRSRIATIVCVVITSNLRLAEAPDNVDLPRKTTGLDRHSVANVSQIVTLDRADLATRVGKLPRAWFEAVLDGIDLVLGR